MFDLYLITDGGAPDEVVGKVRAALAGVPRGRIALQLRDKQLAAHALLELARKLRALTRDAGVALLINDRCDVAKLVGADGVHLPEGGLPPSAARTLLGDQALIGVSCHDAAGVEKACAERASFLAIAPVFAVPGKGAPLGVAGFAALASAATRPAIALGGIDGASVAPLCAAGAHGVAVIRTVFGAPSPAASVRTLLDALDSARAAREC